MERGRHRARGGREGDIGHEKGERWRHRARGGREGDIGYEEGERDTGGNREIGER